MKKNLTEIQSLLKKNKFPVPSAVTELPSSGSKRKYFRIKFENQKTILAAYNPEVNENIAWYAFTLHFLQKNLCVPRIYAKDSTYTYFLLEDLGDTSLLKLVNKGMDENIVKLYKKSILELIRFQVDGIEGLDLDVAFPVKAFNKRSILWDLNYFKYYFVKTHDLSFDEDKLEDDFQNLANALMETESTFFMYRDFQSRNIMIKNGEPFFIDFQGGRQGPLQYDLVSLLYQAKANLPLNLRNELHDYYLLQLEKILPGKSKDFEKHYPLFVYFRLMQVLGAYGFRGLIQRKGHFLESIPFAIENLKQLKPNEPKQFDYPELRKIFDQIRDLKQYQSLDNFNDKLTVYINSFSYKKTGYPTDLSDNGGGFVFDCRFLPNPGRIADLRDFNGTQKPVIAYLEKSETVSDFIDHVTGIVVESVDNYLERNFSSLQVNFGCTGGKHRSVYMADRLSDYLKKYGDKITVVKKHLQKDDW